jgi:tetratricopeptide (TPR) repeat protein
MEFSLNKILFLIPLFLAGQLNAQKENVAIKKGNRLYKEQKFDESQKQYRQALDQSPGNPSANYNLGNAQFRKNSFDDANKSYDQAIANAMEDSMLREQSFYNKGVAASKQQKLEESIDDWKQALKLNSSDEEARENLEKALRELKNKQQQQNKDKKNNQQKKDQDKKNQQDQNQQPKSKLNKQQVEQLLKALQQKEKDVQEKMNQNKVRSLSQPEKDW